MRKKYIQITKKEVKLPLFTDNMTLLIYKENSKNIIKNTVRLINEFSKGTGYKISIKKLRFYTLTLTINYLKKIKMSSLTVAQKLLRDTFK